MLNPRTPVALLLTLSTAVAAVALLVPERPAAPAPQTTRPEGSLTAQAFLSHREVPTDGTPVYARFTIEATKAVGSARPPLDVALVIDQSGSMGGSKIERARLAAQSLLDRMAPTDRLAVIAFDHATDVVHPLAALTDANRTTLRDAIAGIDCRGGTNISGGYSAALALLAEAPHGASRHVFLISDGRAVSGLTGRALGELAATGLRDHEVSVTTLGIGEDFDETTLGEMAIQGGGNFHYVESAETLEAQLNGEWEGLASAASRSTALHITPRAGVRVARVFGFGTATEGDTTSVYVDTIFAGRRRDVVVELQVDGGFDGGELVETVLGYQDVSHQQPVPRRATMRLSAERADGAVSPEHISAAVMGRVREVLSAQAAEEADRLWSRGDSAAARALLEQAQADNEAFRRQHGSTPELERSTRVVTTAVDQVRNEHVIQEKRQIRIRKQRRMDTIEIIAGDR